MNAAGEKVCPSGGLPLGKSDVSMLRPMSSSFCGTTTGAGARALMAGILEAMKESAELRGDEEGAVLDLLQSLGFVTRLS